MDSWIFLFSAYSIVWAGMLAYLIKQFTLQQRLTKEVERLKEYFQRIENG